MAVNGFALGSIGAGAVFAYAGLSGKSVLKTVQSIVQGSGPVSVAKSNTVSGQSSPAASSGSSSPPASLAGGTAGQYQSYAFSQFSKYGWGTDQQQPLVNLWNQESDWNPTADNSSSGAYGIPQALPASKMASAGSDWKTNPRTQIDWGLGYIHDRYGTPQMAWAHEVANNWY
jgi:hypothetical protein